MRSRGRSKRASGFVEAATPALPARRPLRTHHETKRPLSRSTAVSGPRQSLGMRSTIHRWMRPPRIEKLVQRFLRVEGFTPYTFACAIYPPSICAGDWETSAITRSFNHSLGGTKSVVRVHGNVRMAWHRRVVGALKRAGYAHAVSGRNAMRTMASRVSTARRRAPFAARAWHQCFARAVALAIPSAVSGRPAPSRASRTRPPLSSHESPRSGRH
jgi:hypothetical protein